MEQIEKILKPARKFEFWASDEEFYKVAAKTPRSNCVMDVSKLLAAGVKIRRRGGSAGRFAEKLEAGITLNLQLSTMNLLITGGAGFIGSNLIHHVIDDARITKLVNLDCLTYAGHLANLEKVSSHPKYVFEKVDLRDKAATLRVVEQHAITHVMHLAAESHVDRSITGPGDFIHTNIIGTFNLLEACRGFWNGKFDDKKFHHVSTDEVYGSLGATGLFTETTPYAPNSPYSASKASSDMLVRAYHHTYGLPTVITNCSNNYGPFQFPEKLIPVIIQNVLARKPIPVYGDGMNVRDWLYVRDHAEALWTVLQQRQNLARLTTSAATTNGRTSASWN